MAARLPQIATRRPSLRVCIICEGYEEYEYMQRLAEIGAWDPFYDIDLVNAKGNGNIPARYQDRYQNGEYDAVFAFCDTDQKPFEPYDEIKRKINDFHGVSKAADEVVIFGNPCTMQIIILHWRNIILESHKKNFNAPILEEVLHIRGYRARADQRERLFRNVTYRNFWKMYERVRGLPQRDTILGSSNFGKLIDRLRDENGLWTRELDELLQGY